jgi:hypothetical protein|tara:strand:- start:2556 stop:2879 length:324 start_codon:yes stop_codon:yes gene_type:complete
MFTEYVTKEVLRPVTLDAILSFNYSVSLPVAIVRDIVLLYVIKEEGTVEWSNKIGAIKALRELCQVKDKFHPVTLGLREAKEMVEEVYRELQDRERDTYLLRSQYPT